MTSRETAEELREHLEQRLREIAALPVGWADEGSGPPSAATLDAARRVGLALLTVRPLPHSLGIGASAGWLEIGFEVDGVEGRAVYLTVADDRPGQLRYVLDETRDYREGDLALDDVGRLVGWLSGEGEL